MAEAEQWRAVARAANTDLRTAPSQPLEPYLRYADAMLRFRSWQLELIADDGRVVPFPFQSVDLGGPTLNLANASFELASYNDLQSRVLRAFFYYGRTLGVLAPGPCPMWQRKFYAGPRGDDERWQSWGHGRADALHRTDQASQRLRAVAAHDLATVDAFTVARSFPENSPSFRAWMRAAKNFADRAVAEADEAKQNEMAMVTQVNGQYYAGLEVCNNP